MLKIQASADKDGIQNSFSDNWRAEKSPGTQKNFINGVSLVCIVLAAHPNDDPKFQKNRMFEF